MPSLRCSAAALLALAALASCATPAAAPDFSLIYNPSARHHGPDRNPIIVIPGLLGSTLVDAASGRMAWGAFEPGAANPRDPDGARSIALPIGEADLEELRDAVEAQGVLERVRVRLAGVPIEVQAYAGILATLGAGGYRDDALGLAGEVDYGGDHFTCFQFAYDWRRDNVENARRLHEFVLEKKAYVREQYRERYGVDRPDLRFDIAAHSMGGLVTRYFLMYGDANLPRDGSLPELTWKGAEHVERVVLIGTPNAGSTRAFLQLVHGHRVGPLLPYYPAALLGTFPSVYQLLPRPRHAPVVWDGDLARPVDLFDPAVWQRMGWGLAADDQRDVLEMLMPGVAQEATRERVARALLARALGRAKALANALDRPAVAPEGLELFLVAGDAEHTVARVSVDSRDGSIEVVEHGPGDGTVLRTSVLLDERVGGAWTPQLQTPLDFRSALLLPDEHLALTRSQTFRDNVLFWLLEEPRGEPTLEY